MNTTSFSELLRFSKPMMIAAGVITILIMVVGVMGNLLTLAALLRHSKIRTVAAAFIASLCISDLLFCFIALPFAASQFFHGKWIHGDILCSLVPLMRYGSVGVSLLSIAMISINRYILIAFPHEYPNIYTKAKVAIYISCIWLFSYGMCLPTAFGIWGIFGYDERLGTCSIKEDLNGRSPKTGLFVLGFALPCIVIVVCYARIYWVVRKSRKRMQKHKGGNDIKRSEMHVTKMVFLIFLCFLVCYLPITLVKIFDKNVKYPVIHVIGYILIYLSSCLNPVIYVTMNKQYRHAYLNTLLCNFNHSVDSTPSPMPHVSKSHNNMSVTFFKNAVNPNPKV